MNGFYLKLALDHMIYLTREKGDKDYTEKLISCLIAYMTILQKYA